MPQGLCQTRLTDQVRSASRYVNKDSNRPVETKVHGYQHMTLKNCVLLQVVLHSTGDIVFAYKDIPLEIKRIGDKEHPVKVGLSDAYIIDRSGH